MVASQLTFLDTKGETQGEDTPVGGEETGGPTSTEIGGPNPATPDDLCTDFETDNPSRGEDTQRASIT